MATSKHTAADQDFLDRLPGRQLIEFRNYIYTPAYILSNAGRFLNNEWIDIPALRDFLARNVPDAGHDASSARLSSPSASIPIKIETSERPASWKPDISVKAEPRPMMIPPPNTSASIKIRTLYEGGREVLELQSDSEVEDSDIEEVSGELTRAVSRSSSIPTPCDQIDVDGYDGDLHATSLGPADEIGTDSDDELSSSGSVTSGVGDSGDELLESDTVWPDTIKSYVRIGNYEITQKLKNVKRIEYINELPSIYPQFRERTVIVVDLSASKFNIENKATDQLYTIDYLIRNADNDSYISHGSGAGSSTALVTFVPGEEAIECRRASGRCKGAFACEYIDPSLLNVVRYELDPTSRNAVLSAQADTRRSDGTTPEQNAAIFKEVVSNAKCTAVDSNGHQCKGAPMMKPKPAGQSRGHQYFIACSGWTPNFKENHRTHSIPDYVDENLLAKAFAGQRLSTDDDKDTAPCSRLVPPSTGRKRRFCPHAHIVNGKQVQAEIRQFPCSATRSIYVPTDPSIRKALIVQNNTGHNHPMPTLVKASLATKQVYRECVESSGTVGATVAKVDNAPSTKLILKGKTPALFSPALSSKRVKRDLVREVKAKKYPYGLGLTGAFHMYMNHLTKPLPERYIHGYITTPDGGICIFTCVVFLLKLLDDPGVLAFDDDTTYKRVEGEMNEWEVTVFVKAVLRGKSPYQSYMCFDLNSYCAAASVVRAYINRASTDFFEQVFDELQRIKLMVTGKPIALKRFVPGGNLLVMNADMDGAQAIGVCRSVMKHNVPEYSKIPNDTPPEKVAQYFIKICWRHSKEPVHDFRSLVSNADYNRLLDFVYIDSKQALDDFSTFVKGLGVKKIQDWWAHKEINEWIIPCLVKSQSLIPADTWDITPSTTNTNEAQHHWTNSLTGTKLTMVETIEKTFIVDTNTVDEIQTSLQTGVLTNSNNEVSNRMSRNSGRQSKSAQKSRESREQATERKELEGQLAEEVEARRASSARTKDISARLKLVKESSKKKSSSAPSVLAASSSGRVKTVTRALLRQFQPQLLILRACTASSKSRRAAAEKDTVVVDAPQSEEASMSVVNSDKPGTLSRAFLH
ncbi:hypothetical protein B0H11DRAFT_1870607 [Mycena galericulata]|nr:hypothetical protein B0H11DRAFT_1870607 [Mycena galericulata]